MPKIIIASGPVIVENDQVLLNQSGDTDFWKFCGGKMEDYEINLIETAKREAKEEVGIDIEIIKPEPFLYYTEKTTPEGTLDVILVHFLARRIGEIKPGADIRRWKWIPLKDLKKENLAPNILPALKHFQLLPGSKRSD
ncbi:MAG: NUDIX hydrolase [Candidatus Moranbacteria bacterium]|nr:NUDIX hydrolase [Candidatus Moranbacteria bacterium]